jgi:hypothetical protein
MSLVYSGNSILKFYRKMPMIPFKMKMRLFGISRLVIAFQSVCFYTTY